jgi:outer membrane protein TolC
VLAITLIAAAPGLAQEDAEELRLRAAVALAQQRHPLLRAHTRLVEAASEGVRRAQANYRPDLQFDFRTGLVPGARGNAFDSPDEQTDLDELGPFFRTDFNIVQPIYTFGRIEAGTDAARAALAVEEAARAKAGNDLGGEVVRAYWAILAADESLRVAAELETQYELLIREIGRRAGSDDYQTDDVDLFEAESNLFDVERVRLEADDQGAIARRALNTLLQYDWTRTVRVAHEATPIFELSDDDALTLIERAKVLHPDLKRLREAAGIAQAGVRAANAKKAPAFYFNAFFRWAHAGNRTDQRNPFVVDDFNFRSLGYFVGLRWNLNFDRHSIEATQSDIRREAILAQHDALASRVSLEVYEAYRRALRNVALLESARKSRLAAENGLRVSYDLWELGIGQVFRILRLYERDFRLRQLEIEREFELNTSFAELAQAVGDFNLYLDWLDSGDVSIN